MIEIHNTDCLAWLKSQPTGSVDLVFTSPPYEAARTYGIGFALRGQDWVDWAVARFLECVRVCRGIVCWNVEGQTRDFRWSATPALLMADLHRAGVHLRKPPIFARCGIPGSGGPDWLRNDYEFIICGSNGGKLPWSDNTAAGHPPKFAPGGEMSYRLTDGSRRNEWGSTGHATGGKGRRANGRHKTRAKKVLTRPRDGVHDQGQEYVPPKLANPGNIVRCKVGGGHMRSALASENEAAFPESLVEPFIRSFSPPGGTVLDPFCGSGTTLAVAKRLGRQYIGIDVRESQCELSRRRVAEVQRELI